MENKAPIENIINDLSSLHPDTIVFAATLLALLLFTKWALNKQREINRDYNKVLIRDVAEDCLNASDTVDEIRNSLSTVRGAIRKIESDLDNHRKLLLSLSEIDESPF